MAHGNAKKAPIKQAVPSGSKPQATKQNTGQQKPTVPPPVAKPPKVAREKHIIWADDNDIDFEDITFAVPIIISVIILLIFFLRKYIRWNVECQSPNRIDGKTVIITGANTGIGKATATELAKRGGRIVLGCKNKSRGEAVAVKIRSKTRNPDVYCYALDLGSLASIKDFVEEFNHKEPSLHVLINNAAYMGPKSTTKDGYEMTFGVNYLGHFYLTYLLKEKLKKNAPSRVINLVSDSYAKAKFDFEDLALTKYDIYNAYGRSKLAMVVFNTELHRRLSQDIIQSYGVHPGCVCTDLLRNWPGLSGNILRACARIFFKSPEEGCQTVVFCAVADKLREMSGKVLENCNVYKIKASAKDKELGKKLWNLSLHLCGMDDQIPPEEGGSSELETTNGTSSPIAENLGAMNAEEKKEK